MSQLTAKDSAIADTLVVVQPGGELAKLANGGQSDASLSDLSSDHGSHEGDIVNVMCRESAPQRDAAKNAVSMSVPATSASSVECLAAQARARWHAKKQKTQK